MVCNYLYCFAVIGGINAINMIDGIDGLSGSISLVSLLLIGVVTFIAGDQQNLLLIISLAGGMVGFCIITCAMPRNVTREFSWVTMAVC